MARQQVQQSRSVATPTAPARTRPVETLIAEFAKLTVIEQKSAYAKRVTAEEFKQLIDWAYDRNEAKKQAEADYKAARLLIKERAQLIKDIEPMGESVDASFEPRTKKEINAYRVWLRFKKTPLWEDASAKDKMAMFNQCFKVTGDAADILGADVIEKYTESLTDDFAVLKLKRR